MTIREMEVRIEKLENELANAYKEITRLKFLKEHTHNERSAGRKPILNKSQIKEVLQLRSQHETIKSIAEKYNVSVGTIHKVICSHN